MYTSLLVFLLLCSLQLSTQTVSSQPKTSFKNIIAFGDSYTDNGSQTKFYESKSKDISPDRLANNVI